VLKINEQKFIGLSRSDKNNELYWKFRDFYEGEVTKKQTSMPNSPAEPRPETKSPEPKVEPGVSFPVSEPSSEQSEPKVELESEAVRKFREKYGQPTNC
jgi:hypothetical protein